MVKSVCLGASLMLLAQPVLAQDNGNAKAQLSSYLTGAVPMPLKRPPVRATRMSSPKPLMLVPSFVQALTASPPVSRKHAHRVPAQAVASAAVIEPVATAKPITREALPVETARAEVTTDARATDALRPIRVASAGGFDSAVARHAQLNGVPEELVRHIIKRESGGNPRAVSRGNYGLMQIRLATARSLGYSGSADGLLDADTNLTYAVRYLAGAYRAAGGNRARAISYYQRGYHHAAKRRGLIANASLEQ